MMRFLKEITKDVLAITCYYTGITRLFELVGNRNHGLGLAILAYHRVVDSDDPTASLSLPGIKVSGENFKRQIQWLASKWHVLPLEEAIEQLTENKNLPERACAITFDDGWSDNFTAAYPILKENDVPATIFLATDFLNSNRLHWPEQLIRDLRLLGRESQESFKVEGIALPLTQDFSSEKPEAEQLVQTLLGLPESDRMTVIDRARDEASRLNGTEPLPRTSLSYDEIREMSAAGIRFGSHTVTHRILTQCDEQGLDEELRNSREAVQSLIGTGEVGFAYPNGDFNARVREQTSKTGYAFAVTMIPGVNRPGADPFALRRINIHDGTCTNAFGRFSKCRFACEITGFFDWLFRG